MESQKVDEYYKRQAINQMRKDELDDHHKKLVKIKIKQQFSKEKKVHESLKNNEIIEEVKKSRIFEKFEKNDGIVINVNILKEKEFMERSEKQNIQRFEKHENLKKIDKIKEIQCVKTMQKLEEKVRRFDEYK